MRFGFIGVAALFVSFTLFVSANSPASADVVVTFEATYNSEVVFVGATATESSIAHGNNTNVNAATFFGPSPFSPSPFTSSLTQLAGVNPSYLPGQPGALATQYYDSYSGGSIPNTGFRAASFTSGFQGQRG
jgi:hypothetical protein